MLQEKHVILSSLDFMKQPLKMSIKQAKDNVLAQLTLLEQFIVFLLMTKNETVKTMKKTGLMALVKIPPAFFVRSQRNWL